jgi:uncharacterized membrane protein YcjF (UPF0283 family)
VRKIFLLVGAVLTGLYTIAGAVQFIHALWTNNPTTGYGMTDIAANILPFCIGGVFFLSCLGALRAKNPPENNSNPAT